jgi:Tfp pilus assembly protein PilZ
MAPGPEHVLLHGFGAERAELAGRIRSLGYDVQTEPDPRNPTARVVVLPSDFEVVRRGGELDQLARAADALGLRFIALGPRPAEEQQLRLRAKHVRLCLWTPFHDGELRFVLNRAAHDPRQGLLDAEPAEVRHELRVPTSLAARVLVGEREKPARVYSLAVGGCFLETQRPTLVGAQVEIALALPGQELRLAGRVVLTNVPGNLARANLPRGMGVEFLRVPPSARGALEHYVEERARAYEV